MAKIKWRKWNRATHRDFGYFFVGMTIIYGLSGIALNHMRDWNPNYIINTREVVVGLPPNTLAINEAQVFSILEAIGERKEFKKYYFPNKSTLKVFLHEGSVTFDLTSGNGFVEKIKKRPVFYQVNFLHYNPGIWWKYFSDIFSGALILLAITGLFILKGKNGIKGRGAWLTALGIIIPIIFLFFYS